jgi:hypothetical protein
LRQLVQRGDLSWLVLGCYKSLQSRNISFLPSTVYVGIYSVEVDIAHNVINIYGVVVKRDNIIVGGHVDFIPYIFDGITKILVASLKDLIGSS